MDGVWLGRGCSASCGPERIDREVCEVSEQPLQRIEELLAEALGRPPEEGRYVPLLYPTEDDPTQAGLLILD